MKKYVIGCDWGTSSFRLRLIATETQKIVSEITSQMGISMVFNEWKNAHPSAQRLAFFHTYLQSQLQKLSLQSGISLEGFPMVISGMASSSIGMIELPYADLPFGLSGNEAIVSYQEPSDIFPHETWVVSGIKSDNDVMRGEETQLIGIAHWHQFSSHKKYVVLLPGTHSKHVFIENNAIKRFQTYMTGELFSIVSSHSVLKDSIDKASLNHSTPQEMEAFALGVTEAVSTEILPLLFRVRTNQLFQKMTKKENAHYLSGIFIGAELRDLIAEKADEFIVCCGSNLFNFYKMAIQVLQLDNKTTLIAPENVDQATVIGQLKIFQNQVFTVSHL